MGLKKSVEDTRSWSLIDFENVGLYISAYKWSHQIICCFKFVTLLLKTKHVFVDMLKKSKLARTCL